MTRIAFVFALSLGVVLSSPFEASAQAQVDRPEGRFLLGVSIESPEVSRRLGQVVTILHRADLLTDDDFNTVTVEPGQTMTAIVETELGIMMRDELKEALRLVNGLPDADVIQPGAKLKIPKIEFFDTHFVKPWVDVPSSVRTAQPYETWTGASEDTATTAIPGRGMTLEVHTDDAAGADRAMEALYRLNYNIHAGVIDVTASLTALEETPSPPTFLNPRPREYYKECGRAGEGVTGEARYVDLLRSMEGFTLPNSCSASDWPRVFLLDDNPVDIHHGEFAAASIQLEAEGNSSHITQWYSEDAADAWLNEKRANGSRLDHPMMAAPQASARAERQSCRTRAMEEGDHGTYLAGILSSANNGFGFSAIMGGRPLESAATVQFSREGVVPMNPSKFNDLLRHTYTETNPDREIRVMVMAQPFPAGNRWHTSDNELYVNYDRIHVTNSALDYSASRLANRLAKFVADDGTAQSPGLWVVAAGQDDPRERQQTEPRPVRLSALTPQAPQNLGDMSNVVVVTACEDCGVTTGEGSFWDHANFPAIGYDDMVSIAAPGVEIPAPVVNNHYTEADGTSAATAFVASIAAAMIACNSDAYRGPNSIKEALILTGWPFMRDTRDGHLRKVSTIPVVNPKLAVRHPSKNWSLEYRSDLATNLRSEFREIEIEGWCNRHVIAQPADAHSERRINVGRIRRVFRVDERSWVIFQPAGANDRDFPVPTGYFESLASDGGEPVTLKLTDGTLTDLSAYRDLYLGRPYNTVPCAD